MYNKAIVLGRLTGNPELRQTPNGVSATSFSIAVDRPFVAKGSERQVDFLGIICWRQTAEFVCRHFTKGKPILIDGTIQTRQYTDKQGNNRRVWEIVANSVSFTESKSSGAQGSPDVSRPPQEAETTYSSGDVDDFAEMDDGDSEDLPF